MAKPATAWSGNPTSEWKTTRSPGSISAVTTTPVQTDNSWASSNKGTVLHPESTAAAKPDGTSANRPDSPGGSNGVADRPSKASRDASARALASHRVRLFALPPLRPWGCHRQDSSEGIDAPNIMSLIGSWPVSAQIDAEATGQTQHVTDGEFTLEWGDQAAVLSVCGNRDPANQPGGD